MKLSPKVGLPIILLATLAVALAFGACSSSSTPVGGSTKGLDFTLDERGNTRHVAGWEDDHESTSEGPEVCASCHTADPDLAPGCFNASLCHGAEGDDSGDSDSDDSDSAADSVDDSADDSDDSGEV